MRVLSWILFALAAIGAALAVVFYIMVQGMACSFSTSGQPCRMKMPWQMGAEDLVTLFILPWGPVILLVVLGIVARRWR
jgi:hypothetical protein